MPPAMRPTHRYSTMLYLLPPTRVPITITGIILHDLASTCGGAEAHNSGRRRLSKMSVDGQAADGCSCAFCCSSGLGAGDRAIETALRVSASPERGS